MLPPPGPRRCFRRRLLKAPILLSLFNRSREDQLVSFLDQPWSSVDLPVEVQNAMRFVVADLRRDFFLSTTLNLIQILFYFDRTVQFPSPPDPQPHLLGFLSHDTGTVCCIPLSLCLLPEHPVLVF